MSEAACPRSCADPRAAVITTQADWLWVRVLDAVRALEARTYEGTGALVLEVVDLMVRCAGYFAAVWIPLQIAAWSVDQLSPEYGSGVYSRRRRHRGAHRSRRSQH